MKIFPLKLMSPLDRAKVLFAVMDDNTGLSRMNKPAKAASVQQLSDFNSKKKPDYDKQVDIMGCRFSLRELRGIYRSGLERLSKSKIDTDTTTK